MISPGALFVLDLMIDRLRDEGFLIGVDHYLALHEVIQRTDSAGDPEDWKLLLCPIFAEDLAQQESFYRIFDDLSPLLTTAPAARSVELRRDGHSRFKSALLWVMLPAVLVCGVLSFAIWQNSQGSAATPDTNSTFAESPATTSSSDLTPPPSAPNTPYTSKDLWHIFLKAGVLLLPWIGLWIYYILKSRTQRAVFDSRHDAPPPDSWPLFATERPPVLFNLSLKEAARSLKQRQHEFGSMIDLRGTVLATIARYGFPSVRFRSLSSSPFYVCLVRKGNRRDHQAAFAMQLITSLRASDVHIHTYFYDDDPSLLVSEDERESLRIADVARQHIGARLLIFGNPSDILDASTERLAPWLITIRTFSHHALLTAGGLVPTQADAFSAQGLFVAPANAYGIDLIARHFESVVGQSESFVLNLSSLKAVNRTDIKQLESTLGTNGFQWLCACAVYPELNWNLTLQLGQAVSQNESGVSEQTLFSLIRLPWFREGRIPAAIRQTLTDRLTVHNRKIVKTLIGSLLTNNPPPKGSVAWHKRQEELTIYSSSVRPGDGRSSRKQEKRRWIRVCHGTMRFFVSRPTIGRLAVV